MIRFTDHRDNCGPCEYRDKQHAAGRPLGREPTGMLQVTTMTRMLHQDFSSLASQLPRLPGHGPGRRNQRTFA